MLPMGKQSPHLGGHHFLRPVSVQYDFQTFNTTTSPPTRILCLIHKRKSEQLPRAVLLEPRGSIEHSMQTTRIQALRPTAYQPHWHAIPWDFSLNSHGFFPLPSCLSWLQPDKFCFPITIWLFHLKTESSAYLSGLIIFRVLVTALYLTPSLLGQMIHRLLPPVS